jgi:hypothetical protein
MTAYARQDRHKRQWRSLRPISMVLLVFVSVTFPLQTSAQDQPEVGAPDRGGFTLLATVGVGFQKDQALDETNTGLAGLNLGLGGYLSENLALLFRISGTNVDFGPARQVSGFVGPSMLYWTNDKVFLEGGAGIGFWNIEGARERGPGLLFAVGYSIFSSRRHSLHIGLEYAPAFTDPEMVHNLGLVFGWQLL